MVKVADIPPNISQRFIDRARLQEIESRMHIVPPGEYTSTKEGYVYVKVAEIPPRSMLIVTRLGCVPFYQHARTDMESLVIHVKAADEENDRLLEHLKTLDACEELAKSYVAHMQGGRITQAHEAAQKLYSTLLPDLLKSAQESA
jgi:hypothetical protein